MSDVVERVAAAIIFRCNEWHMPIDMEAARVLARDVIAAIPAPPEALNEPQEPTT